ncbi:MAG: PAS domain-containing protein [Anaerolineae bacterium]|nr:PAS domain-containing protein [Anaerolineae bacterium]
MKDERKTKRQLIDELTELRQRLSEERRQLAEAPCRADGLETRNQDNAIRQRMEELLRASVEQWYVTFNTMSDAICLLDPQGRIQRCNRAMAELLDRPLGEILGRHCWEVVHGTSEPIDGCPVTRMWETLSRESLTVPLGDRWFNVSVDPLLADDGQSIGAIYVMTDITERKQAEEALAEQAEQLRILSARLADVQEAERRRMARELHDQVGQNLTALGINLNMLRSHLAQAPESAQSCLDDLLALVKETTVRIRGVMADLRPPELDDYGLLAALRWYADQVGTRADLAVTVEGEDFYPRLPSQRETTLFRIAQEALTNVVKHAQATQATVTVEAGEGLVRMTIVDDGVGFDLASLEEADAASHWGLLTMRERAQAVGAHWCVEPIPGEGTRVVVEMARSRGGE